MVFSPHPWIRLVLWGLPLAWLWFRLIDHMRVEWAVNPQYSYGCAVPFLCLYLVWRKAKVSETTGPRDYETGSVASGPVVSGLVVLLSLLYLPTRLIQEANPEWRLVSWALALEVIGITLLLLEITRRPQLNSEDAKTPSSDKANVTIGLPEQASRFTFDVSRFTFPVLFFLVAVPWPTFIEAPLVQGLMRANVNVTIELLNAFGVPAAPHGNVIEVATGLVGVDDACSGIRSFQATLMLSLFLGGLYALSLGRRVLCVFAGFALSFLFNVARTSLLTWIAAHKGTGAIASWHDPAGVTILVACFLSLWALALWLKQAQTPPSTSDVARSPATPGQSSVVRSPVVSSPPAPPSQPLAVRTPEATSSPSLDVGGSMLDVGCSPAAPSHSSIVSGPLVSSPVVLLNPQLPPVLSPSSVVRSPVVSWSLLAWLFVVEAGTELWYRAHEWSVPAAATWHLEFPRENPTFREVPLSENTRQFLRYDEGYNGTWQEGADQRWQAIFLRWDPGRIAVHLAKSHTPEVCLTAAGRKLLSQSGLRPFAVQGLQLPFRSYVVKDESGPLYVFYCLWDDRADAQAFRTTRMTYTSRLAPVLAGRRNSGQRSLELAVWGVPDQQAADAALTLELQKLVKLGE